MIRLSPFLSLKTSVPIDCNMEKDNQYNPFRFFRATSILQKKKSIFLSFFNNNNHFLSFTTPFMIISSHLKVRLNYKAQKQLKWLWERKDINNVFYWDILTRILLLQWRLFSWESQTYIIKMMAKFSKKDSCTKQVFISAVMVKLACEL